MHCIGCVAACRGVDAPCSQQPLQNQPSIIKTIIKTHHSWSLLEPSIINIQRLFCFTCTSHSRSKWGTWTYAPWSFPSCTNHKRPPRDATCWQSACCLCPWWCWWGGQGHPWHPGLLPFNRPCTLPVFFWNGSEFWCRELNCPAQRENSHINRVPIPSTLNLENYNTPNATLWHPRGYNFGQVRCKGGAAQPSC